MCQSVAAVTTDKPVQLFGRLSPDACWEKFQLLCAGLKKKCVWRRIDGLLILLHVCGVSSSSSSDASLGFFFNYTIAAY